MAQLGTDVTADCFGWLANLGAPAALVAGAALAGFFEMRERLTPLDSDTRLQKLTKVLASLLLLSAFVFEICCVYVTTVTGTLLMGNGSQVALGRGFDPVGLSPMGMLQRELEFEYLVSRVGFLQGLLNWLSGMSLIIALPRDPGEPSSRLMRQMEIVCSLLIFTTVLLMLSFLNKHISGYHNYGHMLWRVVRLLTTKFFLQWPPRPVAMAAATTFGTSLVVLGRAFRDSLRKQQEP